MTQSTPVAFENASSSDLVAVYVAVQEYADYGKASSAVLVEALRKFKKLASPQRRKAIVLAVGFANNVHVSGPLDTPIDLANDEHVGQLRAIGSTGGDVAHDFFGAHRDANAAEARRIEEERAAASDRAAEEAVNAKPAKAERVAKPKGPTIRSVAERMLLEVVDKDPDGRPLGHPYSVILDAIREQFEGAKTSVACLRWYAVHMRADDVRVPLRPRAVGSNVLEAK